MQLKVLLTTVDQPLGVESETCTKNIQAEMYHAQVTLAQGPFSIRAVCTGWGLDFIAENLQAPTTVMHYPTPKKLIKELKKGYDYIGISFVMCTFPKAKILAQLVRKHAPQTKIVFGGYGTVLPECDHYADYVCRGEGVSYFKKLLGEPMVKSFKIPVIKRSLKVLSFKIGPEIILPAGLGCSRGCDFCCTSHFFNKKYLPLITSGKEIHDIICSVDANGSSYRDVGIIDEDFLLDRKRAIELAEWNSKEIKKPIMFSCLTSLKSISQYSQDELLSMGLAGVWVGVESKKAHYRKLKNIDVSASISFLKATGISVLTSMILGYDWHDPDGMEDDFQYLISLRPTLTQFMLYSPCKNTPLYDTLASENRLRNVPYHYHDGFHLLFNHPYYAPEELEKLIMLLFQREYEELGPSIFRYLEVQLNGHELLKDSPNELYRRRAVEHRRLCLKLYPLLKIGIAKAPSDTVRDYLLLLRDRIEDRLPLSGLSKSKMYITPLFYYYTKWYNTFFPVQQPPVVVNRYRFTKEV